jgi:hypothetical protein
MPFDLTEDKRPALVAFLREKIDSDRFPRRLASGSRRAILAKLDPQPTPTKPPPARAVVPPPATGPRHDGVVEEQTRPADDTCGVTQERPGCDEGATVVRCEAR